MFMMLSLQSPHSPHEAPIDPYETYYRQRNIFTADLEDESFPETNIPKSTTAIGERNEALMISSNISLPLGGENQSTHINFKYSVPGARLKHASLLSYMDETIGKVIQIFKKYNFWDNTIFIFASDNGGCVTDLAPGTVYCNLIQTNVNMKHTFSFFIITTLRFLHFAFIYICFES